MTPDLYLVLATCALAAAVAYALFFARPSSAGTSQDVTEEYFRPLLEPMDMAAFSGEADGYRWSQTTTELEVVVPVAAATKSKDVAFKLLPSSLSLVVSGTAILRGRLLRKVKAAECDWTLEGAGETRLLRLTLAKHTPTAGTQHWTSVLTPADGADSAAALRL